MFIDTINQRTTRPMPDCVQRGMIFVFVIRFDKSVISNPTLHYDEKNCLVGGGGGGGGLRTTKAQTSLRIRTV